MTQNIKREIIINGCRVHLLFSDEENEELIEDLKVMLLQTAKDSACYTLDNLKKS